MNVRLATALYSIIFATGLVLSAAVDTADARPRRVTQIPNGAINGCSNCHMSSFGGDARNPFGLTVEADFLTSTFDVDWGPALAAIDSDGDGATNGEELQDPNGEWSAGDPDPGDPALVTMQWDPDSRPATSTAVAASTWAQIKTSISEAD